MGEKSKIAAGNHGRDAVTLSYGDNGVTTVCVQECLHAWVCVHSLFNIFDLHASRAAAAGAHEGLCP